MEKRDLNWVLRSSGILRKDQAYRSGLKRRDDSIAFFPMSGQGR